MRTCGRYQKTITAENKMSEMAVFSPGNATWSSSSLCKPNVITFSEKFTAYIIAYLSFPVSAIATFCNTVTLYTIIKSPRLQSSSNALLGVLSATDLLVGIVILPCYMVICIHDVTGQSDCTLRLFHGYFSHFLCGVSAFMAAVISLDRCIKVYFPLRCRSWNLKDAYKIAILFGIIVLVAIVLLHQFQLIGIGVFNVIASCFIACILLIPIISYIIIFIIARKGNRSIVDSQTSFRRFLRRKREARTAKAIGIVILLLFVCYMPRMFSVLYRDRSTSGGYQVNRWSAFLVFFNAALNPIIYWSRIDDFKHVVSTVLPNMMRMVRGYFLSKEK